MIESLHTYNNKKPFIQNIFDVIATNLNIEDRPD